MASGELKKYFLSELAAEEEGWNLIFLVVMSKDYE
jgi:hypothetical protein